MSRSQFKPKLKEKKNVLLCIHKICYLLIFLSNINELQGFFFFWHWLNVHIVLYNIKWNMDTVQWSVTSVLFKKYIRMIKIYYIVTWQLSTFPIILFSYHHYCNSNIDCITIKIWFHLNNCKCFIAFTGFNKIFHTVGMINVLNCDENNFTMQKILNGSTVIQ